MGSWLADLKISIRQLRKSPTFTLASVAVLALGIGLNAAMFSLIYALGLMGRPFREPERLMQLYASEQQRPDSYRSFSYPAYQQIAQETGLFSGVLAHSPTLVGVRQQNADTRRTFGAVVSRNYFDVLGVPVVQGRGFTEEEDRPGQNIPVVIATHSFWQRTGFDPNVVGSIIRVNERTFTVIGITPRGFTGTMMVLGPELFFPLGVFHTLTNDFRDDSEWTLDRPESANLTLVARLADGVTPDAAASRLSVLASQLERAFPAAYRDARVTMAPLPRFGTSDAPSDESVLGVLGAVMLGLTLAVLLTVCLNLASMLMARGRARRKELAIRLALGGGRTQIVRQLLVEGLLLSLAGGAAGVALAFFAIQRGIAALSAMLPIAVVLDGAASPAVIVATLLFCVLATAWFALGPALRHSSGDVLPDLKPQAGEDRHERRRGLLPRHPLLVAQVALSLALLIAAGLFVRMAQTALAVDFGFRADDTVLAEVDARLGGYDPERSVELFASVERRLAALPGVEAAAVGALAPLGLTNVSVGVRRAGILVPPGVRPETPEEGQSFSAAWNSISGTYFATMGVPLLQGRTFTEAEAFVTGSRVAIIDEALARKLWPDGSALGQRIQFARGDSPGAEKPEALVVGIVGTTRRELFEYEPSGAVYVPLAQEPMSNVYFHVRPVIADAGFAAVVRREIREAAPGLPVFSATTYADHVGSAIEYWALKLTALLFAAFGGFALLVALVGIYGVLSYAVVRRTREIGIRMAVGATANGVRGMILREGLALTLLGVAIGWLLGVGVGRLLGSIFVDLAAFDTLTFTAIPAGFIAAAALAAWLPARRATSVHPMNALRAE